MFVKDGIVYEEQYNKLTVMGLENKSYSGNVFIPERAQGKHVVAIAPRAFEAATISSISLPYTLEKIGKGAFSCCDMLEEVFLTGRKAFVKNHILHIEEQAFINCSRLKNFETTKALILDPYSFCGCHQLYGIDTILVVHKNALKDCTSLKYLFFEDNCELTNFTLENTGVNTCEFRGNANASQEFLDSVVTHQCSIVCFADSNLCDLAYEGVHLSINELPF